MGADDRLIDFRGTPGCLSVRMTQVPYCIRVA